MKLLPSVYFISRKSINCFIIDRIDDAIAKYSDRFRFLFNAAVIQKTFKSNYSQNTVYSTFRGFFQIVVQYIPRECHVHLSKSSLIPIFYPTLLVSTVCTVHMTLLYLYFFHTISILSNQHYLNLEVVNMKLCLT